MKTEDTNIKIKKSTVKRLQFIRDKHGFSGHDAVINALLNQTPYLKLFLKSEGRVI